MDETFDKKTENNMDVMGISRKMQVFIETALTDDNLEPREIELLRRKAVEFGEDPDVVEMATKAQMIEGSKPKTVTITVIPKRNLLSSFGIAMKKYCVFKGRSSRAEFWQFVLATLILLIGLPIAIEFGF
jgi:hypothetical protein